MNRFKKWLRSQGVKLECDYGYMPCGELDGVWVNTDKLQVVRYYYTVGTVITQYNRDGSFYEDLDNVFDNIEFEEPDPILSNHHCDTYGVCGGYSCPNYFKCNG